MALPLFRQRAPTRKGKFSVLRPIRQQRTDRMEWLKPCFNGLLRSGPIPKHLAFIMDGNRRFAERNAAGNLEKGHSKGFDKVGPARGLQARLGCTG